MIAVRERPAARWAAAPSALPTDAGGAPVPAPRDRAAALALSLAAGVGPVTYLRWARADGGADASLVRRVATPEREQAMATAAAALARADAIGARLLLLGDAAYPASLLELPDPPPALWALGDLALLAPARVGVALVGTRSATPYGLRVADAFARAAAEAGATVLSGMARGIDAAAHLGALGASGGTIAVLGSGVDVPYPRAHRALHGRIAREGLLLSEALPGAAPTAGAFPRRNRIVAALARATVVVEAGSRSGALITAGLALDLGRDVGAVPGPVDVPQASGSNALLRDGAAVVSEPADLLALLGLGATVPSGRPAAAAPPTGLDPVQLRVWRALGDPARDLDVLAARADLDARSCATAVGLMEAVGVVRTAFDGSIARC